jgi:hypothetical protein
MRPLRAPTPDPPKPLERWPVAVRFGVAAGPELIVKGSGSFGFSAEIGARYRFVSLGVEARGEPSLGSVAYPYVGSVSFARASSALLLCAHYGLFAGCVVGEAGRFFFPDHAGRLPASILSGAAGGRAGLEFPVLPPRLFLGVAVDLRAPIPPTKKTSMGQTVFETAGPSVGLGFALRVELPL